MVLGTVSPSISLDNWPVWEQPQFQRILGDGDARSGRGINKSLTRGIQMKMTFVIALLVCIFACKETIAAVKSECICGDGSSYYDVFIDMDNDPGLWSRDGDKMGKIMTFTGICPGSNRKLCDTLAYSGPHKPIDGPLRGCVTGQGGVAHDYTMVLLTFQTLPSRHCK